jgi:hypothetical protein
LAVASGKRTDSPATVELAVSESLVCQFSARIGDLSKEETSDVRSTEQGRLREGSMRNHCRGRTKFGKRCKAVAIERGLCAFHADPLRAAHLVRMGGRKNRRYPLAVGAEPLRVPQTAKDVKDLLAETMASIHAGQLDPRMGSVMAHLGTSLLKFFEVIDLEERIGALERLEKENKEE